MTEVHLPYERLRDTVSVVSGELEIRPSLRVANRVDGGYGFFFEVLVQGPCGLRAPALGPLDPLIDLVSLKISRHRARGVLCPRRRAVPTGAAAARFKLTQPRFKKIRSPARARKATTKTSRPPPPRADRRRTAPRDLHVHPPTPRDISHALAAMADLFRGAIIRDCLVKCVVDGKTLKVLLNPLGWAPKPSGGWLARPTSATAPLRGPSEEVRDGLVDAAAAIPHAYRRDMSADALPVRVVAAFYGSFRPVSSAKT